MNVRVEHPACYRVYAVRIALTVHQHRPPQSHKRNLNGIMLDLATNTNVYSPDYQCVIVHKPECWTWRGASLAVQVCLSSICIVALVFPPLFMSLWGCIRYDDALIR